MSDVLDKPPEEPEGDDTEAGGGKPADGVTEDALSDTEDLDDDDEPDS